MQIVRCWNFSLNFPGCDECKPNFQLFYFLFWFDLSIDWVGQLNAIEKYAVLSVFYALLFIPNLTCTKTLTERIELNVFCLLTILLGSMISAFSLLWFKRRLLKYGVITSIFLLTIVFKWFSWNFLIWWFLLLRIDYCPLIRFEYLISFYLFLTV